MAEVGEETFIRRLHRMLRDLRAFPQVHAGIGDDAAILGGTGRRQQVVCTDVLVENVDFKRQWSTAADIGHKAAAANLSDLAAMGATPTGLLASLQVRPSERADACLRLLRSVHRLGAAYGAPLVGGDMSRTAGPLAICVTAMGTVAPGRALRRRRAGQADVVLCTGGLGAAAAGLWGLQGHGTVPPACLRAQRRPMPQVRLGQALCAWGRVTACADISDGLAQDAQLLAGPGLWVQLDAQRLPLAGGLTHRRWAAQAAHWALCGGEDLGLVIAVRPRDVVAAQAIGARIGQPLHTVGVVQRGKIQVRASGFDHFRLQK